MQPGLILLPSVVVSYLPRVGILRIVGRRLRSQSVLAIHNPIPSAILSFSPINPGIQENKSWKHVNYSFLSLPV